MIHLSYTAAEIAEMHTQDIANDAAVSDEQQTQDFTRSQTRALEDDQMSPSQQFSPVVITSDPTIYTPLPPSTIFDEGQRSAASDRISYYYSDGNSCQTL